MIVRPEEWISKPDNDGNGFLKAWVAEGELEFPIPIETHNVFLDDVKTDEAQEFDFIFECADKPLVYKDLKAYNNDKERHPLASESVIPIGLFPASDDEDFVPTPWIIMNGKVVKTYEDSAQFGFEESDVLFSLSCLGNEYDAVMHAEFSDSVVIEEGNIVSCVYWVQGWPKED